MWLKEWALLSSADLKAAGISHIYCLCRHEDLVRYRVPCLLQDYTSYGFSLHHYPVHDGGIPDIDQLMMILKDIKTVLERGNKAFIQLVV